MRTTCLVQARKTVQNDRIKAFQINVAPEVLSDLQERLKKTRWSY
jgi:hypothetical protein